LLPQVRVGGDVAVAPPFMHGFIVGSLSAITFETQVA